MRILYVLSEHRSAITPSRLAAYEADRARIASLTAAMVEMIPYESLETRAADALVLSGSTAPWAEHEPAALERHLALLREYEGPVLGICAGMQNLVRAAGGSIAHAARPTYGFIRIDVLDDTDLFAGHGASLEVLERHEDEVAELPETLRVLAASDSCSIEAVAARDRPWWGTQFHPEAWDDEHPAGKHVLERFLQLARAPLRGHA